MPEFRRRTKLHPEEVAVAIANDGVMATVIAPQAVRLANAFRDLRLSTALHFAGSLADRMGTNVAIIDESEIYYIEDYTHLIHHG